MRRQGWKNRVASSPRPENQVETIDSPNEVVSGLYPPEVYSDLRKTYAEGEQQSYQDFDKAMSVLSGGALALSITFVKEVARNPPQYTWILFISWVLFTAALLATLLSFMTAQRSFRTQQENLERIQYGKISPEQARNRWSNVTAWLNGLSILSFIGGVFSFGLFSYLNLP